MTEEAGPTQRHEIFPSMLASSPEDYPEPDSAGGGVVTRLALTTPDGEPVGVLLYDDKGLSWTPAANDDESAQEHAAELLTFIRGNKEQDAALADVIENIRDAYAGDFKEDLI